MLKELITKDLIYYSPTQGGWLHHVFSADANENIGQQIQPQNRDEMNAGFHKAAYTALANERANRGKIREIFR